MAKSKINNVSTDFRDVLKMWQIDISIRHKCGKRKNTVEQHYDQTYKCNTMEIWTNHWRFLDTRCWDRKLEVYANDTAARNDIHDDKASPLSRTWKQVENIIIKGSPVNDVTHKYLKRFSFSHFSVFYIMLCGAKKYNPSLEFIFMKYFFK